MNYPDDYNVPTFAAGKSIAVSRTMGIGIMSGFFIIIFLCGLLIWTIRSARVEPYILATGGINDEWQIVKPGDTQPKIEMTRSQVIQESVVWKFVQDWFSISNDAEVNKVIWDTSCKRSDCYTTDGSRPCRLYCVTSDDLFRNFKEKILPTYEALFDSHEYWTPDTDKIRITPVGDISIAGGTWRIQLPIVTNNGTINVMAYAKVTRDTKAYPNTMGYHIADFNAYRIDK